MKTQSQFLKTRSLTFGFFLMGALLISCGDDEVKRIGKGDQEVFSKVSRKMDLVLALDDSPSASFKNPSVMPNGVQSFINELMSDGTSWDIRIIAMSLTNPNRRSKIWANKPYSLPGEKITDGYLIDGNGDGRSSSSELGQLTGFYSVASSCESSSCMFEPGMENIETLLSGYAKTANFHRDSAQLAIVVFSNGIDTSDGLHPVTEFPYEQVDQIHMDSLSDLKDLGSDHVRYFSVVSTGRYSNGSCNGSNAYRDYRYEKLSRYFGGAVINICAQGSFSNAMKAVANSTGPVELGLYNRVVTNCRPNYVNLDDFSVTVTVNGKTIPKDDDACKDETYASANASCFGWVWEGYRTDNPFNRLYPPRERDESGNFTEPGLPEGHIIRFNGPSRFSSGDEVFVGC